MTITTINPASGEKLETYQEHSDKEIGEIIQSSHRSFLEWRLLPVRQRAHFLAQTAAILKKRSKELAELMAREMGKPLKQGISEAEKCAWVCEYYAEHAADFLGDEHIATDATESFVTYQPLGVVLAIMPWNFPFWQVFRFAAPALAAGNAAVLKHSENSTGCALAIEQIFQQAGFPDNLFRTLVVNKDRVEKTIIDNEHVRAVTLTGSTRAGKAVAQAAGSRLKKTVLELGGSDPYIVLKDADIEMAAETCVASRLINSGQSCIAAKRFIVEKDILKPFTEAVVEKMESKKMGDPFSEDSDIGPMAREDLRDTLHNQVAQSLAKGAKRLTGGTIPDRPGAWYPATVLADVSKAMPAYEEELFGPVAAIITAKNDEDAIRIANDSPYGLGGAVFTSDLNKGRYIATKLIDSGNVFVNSFVKSDPRLPFGGVKESGYGRELSHLGIKEFVNAKTVYIK